MHEVKANFIFVARLRYSPLWLFDHGWVLIELEKLKHAACFSIHVVVACFRLPLR